ncbi:hypothetical protein [Weissella viridescens]|uniref:hypothetical protein n=1 Tax=Weissella viridescens TaxID=1629 RepID=UPI003AF2F7B0
MKKLNIGFLVLLLLVSVGIAIAGYDLLAEQHTYQQHVQQLDQFMQGSTSKKKAQHTELPNEKAEQVAVHFFDIYHTYDSQETYRDRQEHLKPYATKAVLTDGTLFDNASQNQARFIETNQLQSHVDQVVYYPISDKEGLVSVAVAGRYNRDEKRDNAGTVSLLYRTHFDTQSQKLTKVTYLGNEYVLSDSDLSKQLNTKE